MTLQVDGEIPYELDNGCCECVKDNTITTTGITIQTTEACEKVKKCIIPCDNEADTCMDYLTSDPSALFGIEIL